MSADERWVPKVHPATREVETDDPMELVATAMAGHAVVMLECIVQEFACMGWDEKQLMELFYSPDYPILIQLREAFGETAVSRQVRSILARQGTFRVRETIDDTPEPDELEPELIQITVRTRAAMPS